MSTSFNCHVESSSLKLSSLDAHPANLSLLVSYEIEVILLDSRNRRELARRSKQSQIQIHLKSIERLLTEKTIKDFYDIGAVIDRDAQEIIGKFPIIKVDRLHEIKHHLTYLYKRHSDQCNPHSSLSQEESSVCNDYKQQTFKKLIKSARVNSASISSADKNRINNIQETPKSQNFTLTDEQIQEYVFKFDDQEELEKADISQLNKYIEGLYDDLEEKIASSRKIRSLANCAENLMELAIVNKMLTSAMYRVLREDGNKSYELAKNVLSYFIQLSSFIEFIETLKQFDLITTVTSLAINLANDSKATNKVESIASLELLSERLQIVEAQRACILLLFNLSQVTISYEVQMCKSGMVELLMSCLIDTMITRDRIADHQAYHRDIFKLMTTTLIFLQRLSACKKNIDTIKELDIFLSSLIDVINISYKEIRDQYRSLSDSNRCGTALTDGHKEFLLISAFQLINNLLYNDRIRQRISRNELFKVAFGVFVAHRTKRSAAKLNIGSICRCHQCFSSLSIMYQMSCDNDFNRQIAKSSLVNKSLLNYAKSVALDIGEQSSAYNWEGNGFEMNYLLSEQVYTNVNISAARYNQDENKNSNNLKLTSLDHLLLAFFINVTTTKNFIISINRSEISSQLNEYIRIAMIKLSADSRSSDNSEQISQHNDCSSSSMSQNRLDIIIYLHLKIIRNITQYYKHLSEQIRIEFQDSWFHMLLSFAMRHFNLCRRFSDDLILESIGILGNYTHDKGATKMNWLKILENTNSSDLLMHNLDISRNLTDDDTVLVTIYFVGTLLENVECYHLLAGKGLVNRIKQIVNLRQEDEEILIHSLYALICTTIHGENREQLDSKSFAFVDQLITLTGHKNKWITRYSSVYLDLLSEINEDVWKDRIREGRFIVHNSSWLQMINDHRNNISQSNDLDTDSYIDNKNDYDVSDSDNSDLLGYSLVDPDILKIVQYTKQNSIIEADRDGLTSGSSSSSNHAFNRVSEHSLVDEESDFDSDLGELLNQTSLPHQRLQHSAKQPKERWNKASRSKARPQTSYMTRHSFKNNAESQLAKVKETAITRRNVDSFQRSISQVRIGPICEKYCRKNSCS